MSEVGFEFPVDTSGQWDGFNDPGIEHFTGNPFQHLGREVPQNTIDAMINAPAKIDIQLRRVRSQDIPDIESLRRAVDHCVDSARTDENERAVKFFALAQKLLKKAYVNILQIADSNTTGVRGPCENGTPFFAMMKATGQSRKAETSSGSYGIGKFAPYTVSALRTVFLSTVWADGGGRWHHYVQGKAVLMSHVGDDGKTRRGTGFWGVRKQCQPVIGRPDIVPEWLRRAGTDNSLEGFAGTTLSIVAFDEAGNWQDVLAANIVENFFGAILRGELEVQIQGAHAISATTLSGLLTNKGLQRAVNEEDGEPEKFQNVAGYISALSDNSVVIARTENQHLGECELRLIVRSGLPKRVAVLRNGMLITEEFPGLRRFSDFKDFVALLECKSQKGLALLRAMEPPRHDAFEPDRLPPDKRTQGRTALRELSVWVREMLRRYAQDPVSEQTDLSELADYFADEAEEGKDQRKDENPSGAIIIRARPLRVKPIAADAGADAPRDDESGSDSEAEGDGQGPGRGHGTGGWGALGGNDASGGDAPGEHGGATSSKRSSNSAIALQNVRAVPLTATRRRIAFSSTVTGYVRIQLEDSGADVNYPLPIVTATEGKVIEGCIDHLEVTAGARTVIEVELPEEFYGTLRVVANAV